MRAQHIIAVALIVPIGLFLTTACKKKTMVQTLHAAEANHVSATAKGALNQKNLGVLPLSNHIATTVTLGKNKRCTITPTLLKSGDVQLILSMETQGEDGSPVGMSVARVVAKSGEPFDVYIGDMDLAFTPQLTVQ